MAVNIAGLVRCVSGDVMEGNSTTVHACIPDQWVCDNWNDCGDASDESLTLCGKYDSSLLPGPTIVVPLYMTVG
jgi:hypothetical protein